MDKTKYELPKLPYEYNALEPYILEEIMTLHHTKHHQTYVNNLNAAIEPYADLYEKSAEDLLMDLNNVPEAIRTAVRNNAGGHVNHSMFWQIMSPARNALSMADAGGPNGGGEPTGKLSEEINKYFRSFAEFQNAFNDAGAKRFGSGWVWLVQKKDGALEIISTANQDNPLSDGHRPIMGNDVWEHAYYLQYKNMRVDYLKAWWNIINWQEVEKRFK